MEENERQINVGSGRQRIKKKSTLAKLKEKKERESGSTISLRRDSGENGSQVSLNHHNEIIEHEKPVDLLEVKANGSSKPDFYHFSTKDPRPVSSSNEISENDTVKPRPKPRGNQKRASISSNQISPAFAEIEVNGALKNGETTVTKVENLNFDNGSSDSNTNLRRKNFKTSGQIESLESITSGGFTPKPPVTPRSSKTTPRTPRGYNRGKTEKRSQDRWTSGDESEGDGKVEKDKTEGNEEKWMKDKNLFDISDLIVDEVELASVKGKKTVLDSDSRQKESHRLLTRRNSNRSSSDINNSFKPPVSDNSSKALGNISTLGDPVNGSHGNPVLSASNLRDESPQRPYLRSRRRSSSCSPARALPDKFKPSQVSPSSSHLSTDTAGLGLNLNNSDSHQSFRTKAASFSTPTSSHTIPVSTQVLFTSNENSRSISTPSSSRLEPVSPRSHPPPLPKDFSSRSLRTSYKIDANIRPQTSSGIQRVDGEKSDSGTASGGDKVSQKSFSSGSVLPIITTKEARSRSYLEGSVSSATPSMLGSEELERYFPDRKVNVLVGTWNMNELKEVTTPLDDFILPEKCDYVQDIYAIGTQENNMNKKEWEIKLQETLGPSHVMFHSVTLGALHLIIFIRRDLIWFCSVPEDHAISLRAVTMVKTKGAIGISFTMFGSYYLFINCHLTSDRDNENSKKKNRMGDYFKVIQDMDFKLVQELKQTKTANSTSSKKRVDITSFYDCVFWCGDLNFRIERQRHAVEGKVNQITSEEFPNFEALLGGDQLLKYMTEGKIFTGFQEGRINFHPTFKFDVNKDTYDSSLKNRVPSYTDRIMFRSKKKNDITCLHYDAVMELKISDHRPVFGQFEAGIKPGRDNMVYGAGHFDRTVYMEGMNLGVIYPQTNNIFDVHAKFLSNQRRAANHSSSTTQKKPRSSSICSIQ